MSAGAAAAAAAASSALDFGANSIMANSANAKSKRAASRAAILDYVLTNQLMDKQNEYNKPINQMARLREAGLNPNLVYGDGGATMASASGSVNVGASDVTPATGSFGVLSKMQTINAMKQQDANIAETEARTNAIDENIELKREELEERKRFNDERLKLLGKQIEHYGVQDDKSQAEIERLKHLGIRFTDDPVGYVVGQAGRVTGVLEDVHDATLDFLNNTFGKRNVHYMKGGKK